MPLWGFIFGIVYLVLPIGPPDRVDAGTRVDARRSATVLMGGTEY